MLAMLEIGNSNIVFAVYARDVLRAHWRLNSDVNQTSDEYGLLLSGFLRESGIQASELTGCTLASVVPSLTETISVAAQSCLKRDPLVLNSQMDLGIRNLCSPPEPVGIDRLLNAAAAYKRFGGPAIVIDFGTATTFDAVSADGGFLGGAIAPGIRTAADALTAAAPRLGRIELEAPPNAVGTNSSEALQSGVVLGYAALVDGLVDRMRSEIGRDARVITTGGLAPTMMGVSKTVELSEPHLTLEGIRLAYERLGRPSTDSRAP